MFCNIPFPLEGREKFLTVIDSVPECLQEPGKASFLVSYVDGIIDLKITALIRDTQGHWSAKAIDPNAKHPFKAPHIHFFTPDWSEKELQQFGAKIDQAVHRDNCSRFQFSDN